MLIGNYGKFIDDVFKMDMDIGTIIEEINVHVESDGFEAFNNALYEHCIENEWIYQFKVVGTHRELSYMLEDIDGFVKNAYVKTTETEEYGIDIIENEEYVWIVECIVKR